MSVLQSQEKEVRYLRRKGLEEESRIVGNALRDQIRQYGVDCVYYKLNEMPYTNFKDIIDQNTRLKHAYGYNLTPDYTMSAHMITYAEVQQDIFQLNKYGHVPNSEIDFNFDKIDFACALATKYGQLKEYPVDHTPVNCEVPPPDMAEFFPYSVDLDESRLCYRCLMLPGQKFSDYNALSDSTTSASTLSNCILSGWCRALLSGYELSDDGTGHMCTKEMKILCDPFEHTSFNTTFPVNSDLYRSLKYEIECDDYLETMIYLVCRIYETKASDDDVRYILSGHLAGSVLFYDIDMVQKYVSLVRPAIGDIIAIDFPDDKNHDKYQITDCYDKQLTQDGISPLLHNYIWKCKAIRYTNAQEELAPQSEADDRVEEMHKYEMVVDSVVADHVSMYNEIGDGVKEDAAYGGYGTTLSVYDAQVPQPIDMPLCFKKSDYVEDGSERTLMAFSIGSKLFTDGYVLMFKNDIGNIYQLGLGSGWPPPKPFADKGSAVSTELFGDLRWLKATDSQIVFINVEGKASTIACDKSATKNALEICVNSLKDKTLDVGEPLNGFEQNFYKFRETRSYLWSDGKSLFAKLESSPMLYCIAGMPSFAPYDDQTAQP